MNALVTWPAPAAVLAFLIWPAIGMVNAALTRPQSVMRAIGNGLLTSGVLAIVFATINVVGGFLVTHRMLGMFRRKN